jgi:glucose/arabinose dehydrogenase
MNRTLLTRLIGAFTLFFLLALQPAAAQDQPDVPCYWRPTSLDKPWVDPQVLPCLEEVVDVADGGELAFTALTVAPDGTLYAARPLAGEVWALTDGDGDGLPETPRLFADGLTLPNALYWDWLENTLFVAGGPHIYRIDDGIVTTVVDNLPAGPGYWTGGLTKGVLDGGSARLFVGAGAACDTCASGDTGRGAVWSFLLDGTDGRIEATGFRQPAALTFALGEVWVVDSAPAALFEMPLLDEVNRLSSGTDFGFPRCFGLDTRPECADTAPPAFALPTGSTPLGLAAYPSDVMPGLTNALLIALAGSNGQVELRGYALAQVRPLDEQGFTVLMPDAPDGDFASLSADDLNYRTVGLYPARPYGVAVHPRLGWIYLSLSGGRILAIRPESEVVY